MKEKLSAPVAAAVAAGLIVGMLVLSYLPGILGSGSEPPPLPEPTESVSDGGDGLPGVLSVEVTPQNVRSVIRSLERASGYTQTVTSTLYYDGGSSAQTVTQYVRGGACRTDVLHGGAVAESYLRADGSFYAWAAGGGTSYFKGAAGDFSADSMAMLPDWQTVAELPVNRIAAAETDVRNGEPSLLVTAKNGSRTTEYVISTITGLLVSARYAEDGETIREVRVTGISTELPEESHFVLPDGVSVLPASALPPAS